MARLLPRQARSTDVGELRILNQFLTPSSDAVPQQPWPTQTEAAEALKLPGAVCLLLTRLNDKGGQ